MTAIGRRLAPAIRDAAATSTGAYAFRRRVLELVGDHIPFEAACLATTEPTAMLPTSLTTLGYEGPDIYATVLDIEYGADPEPGSFDTMRGRPVPVRTHREATGGRPRSSRFYAEVLAPNGLDHEVRMIFRDDHGLAWGACTLARSGADFSEDEADALGSVVGEVAHGLSSTLFRDQVTRWSARPDGPALVVVDALGEVETCTEAALDHLRRLAWGPATDPMVHLPAVLLAGWLRRSDQLSATWRIPATDGTWVVARAGLVDHASPARVALTFEPATAGALVPLIAAAYRLTARESEVLVHLLADRTRDEIARSLCLSPHTVHDHVKSISAKTGVTGRRGLASLLVQDQCVPRLGGKLGADGWFVRA